MQFDWMTHFERIVIPAWQAYLAAEERLTQAINAKDWDNVERLNYEVLREGGAAAIYLHQFSDIILNRRPPFLPDDVKSLKSVRKLVADRCFANRSEEKINDVRLLGDVADAIKHAELTRKDPPPEVPRNDRVVTVGSGWGALPYGEGKNGGLDQMVVMLPNNKGRALAGILQNVVDAWRVLIGWPPENLPPIGS